MLNNSRKIAYRELKHLYYLTTASTFAWSNNGIYTTKYCQTKPGTEWRPMSLKSPVTLPSLALSIMPTGQQWWKVGRHVLTQRQYFTVPNLVLVSCILSWSYHLETKTLSANLPFACYCTKFGIFSFKLCSRKGVPKFGSRELQPLRHGCDWSQSSLRRCSMHNVITFSKMM